MAYDRLKPDHNGAKNGGGGYGKRADVKRASKKLRRELDRALSRAILKSEGVKHGSPIRKGY